MDDLAWLMEREIPRLRRYAMALERDPDRADDLVQDCLERAYRKRGMWKRKGSMRAWLFRIAYNVFLNKRKSRRARLGDIPLEDMPDAGAASPNQEKRMVFHNIMDALYCLPVEQRTAIVLTAVEGLSYTEAAAFLGIKIGTLRSRLARGRETLRDVYHPDGAVVSLRRVK